MTDHTPGPWTIDGERIGPGGEPVALLCDTNAPRSGTVVDWPRMRGQEVDDAENEANARLIASAPDMASAIATAGLIVRQIHATPSMTLLQRSLALLRAHDALSSIYFKATGQPIGTAKILAF